MIFNHFLSGSIFKKTFLGIVLTFTAIAPVKADRIRITSYGHSALLIKGGGYSVLLNPFKTVGCAEGLKKLNNLQADVVLASSELADEGNRNVKGIFFSEPGSYRVRDLKIEGVQAPHDRFGGRRYGFTTAWQWVQDGTNFIHLGGSVTPLKLQQKLLFGRPDVLVIAVGGGSKVYSGKEAAAVVQYLKPKIVIPVQYARGKNLKNCDLTGIEPFLNALKDVQVKEVGRSFTLKSKIPDSLTVHLMP
ncbi:MULTISPECIES: MBL fold metallo-hydrolase [Prochlorococcus]|uniref:MBL fold metallo-hydrolase n=1 Tax=Prochlorococcus TaxID=1218 RepID=UPI0005338488|nr:MULTISPECIES: MBL fold metallo-hydrolase [Prochlorococcus]KGG13187.1 Inactivated Zn-dependent hydrolase of the beta-lactamase fold [Prochlorococcus sp. MIT 0601]